MARTQKSPPSSNLPGPSEANNTATIAVDRAVLDSQPFRHSFRFGRHVLNLLQGADSLDALLGSGKLLRARDESGGNNGWQGRTSELLGVLRFGRCFLHTSSCLGAMPGNSLSIGTQGDVDNDPLK